MTKRFLKISMLVIFLLGVCLYTTVLATDININLPTNNTTGNTTTNNTTGNTTTDNNTNTNNTVNNNTTNEESNSTTNNTQIGQDSETLKPNNVGNASQSGLSIGNMINIILIAIGVILILLAIAIIIRLK